MSRRFCGCGGVARGGACIPPLERGVAQGGERSRPHDGAHGEEGARGGGEHVETLQADEDHARQKERADHTTARTAKKVSRRSSARQSNECFESPEDGAGALQDNTNEYRSTPSHFLSS